MSKKSSDFLFGPILGEGQFGTVVYAELKHNNHHHNDTPLITEKRSGYAIKIIPKSETLRHNQIQAVLTEKFVLSEITSVCSETNTASELIIKLFSCFHDANYLYFVVELCAGGTLFDLIESRCIFDRARTSVIDISWVTYYSAQILRALEFLHQRGIVHRDLSPKNICLTYPKGGIKLVDFGASAVFVIDINRESYIKRWTPVQVSKTLPHKDSDFVGTVDYASPEVLRGKIGENAAEHALHLYPAIDLWSFGCLIFYMIVGKSPFHASSDFLACQNILDYTNGKYNLDLSHVHVEKAKQLISQLLSIDAGSRLGTADAVICSGIPSNNSIKNHGSSKVKIYESIRDKMVFDKSHDKLWTMLEEGLLDPPYLPSKLTWMDEVNRNVLLKSFEKSVLDY